MWVASGVSALSLARSAHLLEDVVKGVELHKGVDEHLEVSVRKGEVEHLEVGVPGARGAWSGARPADWASR